MEYNSFEKLEHKEYSGSVSCTVWSIKCRDFDVTVKIDSNDDDILVVSRGCDVCVVSLDIDDCYTIIATNVKKLQPRIGQTFQRHIEKQDENIDSAIEDMVQFVIGELGLYQYVYTLEYNGAYEFDMTGIVKEPVKKGKTIIEAGSEYLEIKWSIGETGKHGLTDFSFRCNGNTYSGVVNVLQRNSFGSNLGLLVTKQGMCYVAHTLVFWGSKEER
jgi:hypothetical protein